jgi:VanZ family protein
VAENPSIASTSDAVPTRAQVWWRRATTIALCGYLALMFSATHAPKIPKAIEPRFSDKWQHTLAYLGLGVLAGLWWGTRRALWWRGTLIVWGAILAYGAFDEITQPIVGRDADILDWRSDAIGSAIGLALITIGIRFFWKPVKTMA